MKKLAVALLCTGCLGQRTFAPPAAPFPIAPKVEGAGNVVLDVAGRKANAYAVQGEEDVFMCVTPCVVSLRQGSYTFRFTDPSNARLTSTADFVVPASGKILVRHMLGYDRKLSPGAGFAGLTMAGVGLVAAFIGAAAAGNPSGAMEAGSLSQGLGAAMLIGGGLLFGGGVVILVLGRGERQEGATTVTPL